MLYILTVVVTLSSALTVPPLEMMKSILLHYHYGCFTFLHSASEDFQDDLFLVVMRKQLSILYIPSPVIHINNFNNSSRKFGCRNKRSPIYVILSADNCTRTVLQELSNESQLFSSSWLLFMANEMSIKNYLSDIYIPINCKFLIAQPSVDNFILTEAYQVAKGLSLQTFQFGTWSRKQGLNLSSLDLYERRNNLHNFLFKGTAVEEPPITMVRKMDENLQIDGFLADVWRLLQSKLNFTTEFMEALDNAYGSLDNGTWSGIIEMLINKEVDLAMNEFRITTERLEVVDYTLPIIFSRYQVFMKEPSSCNPMWWGNFLAPFSTHLWLTILSSIIIFGIFGSITFHLNKRFLEPMDAVEQQMTFLGTVHIVLGAFCQQGQSLTPRSNSCRVIFLCVYIVGLVLLAAYSAALISSLAKRKPVLPFNSLEELVTDGTYKLGLLHKSAEFNVFYGSQNKLLNDTYNNLIKPEKDSLPTTSQEGLTRTCEDKFAFFGSYDIINGLLHTMPCKIIHLSGDSFKGSVSMVLAKNSPYRELFNHYLLKLRIGGVLQTLRRKKLPVQYSDITSSWISVDIHDIAPLLAVLAAGIITSLLFLILEMLSYWLTNRRYSSPFPWTTRYFRYLQRLSVNFFTEETQVNVFLNRMK